MTFANDDGSLDMSRDWLRVAEQVLVGTYTRPARLFVKGVGAWLESATGERYLDMTSGIAVMALGHGAPELVQVLRESAEELVHVSNLYHTAPPVALAEALVARSFADRVFFANSGAEANEGAIKFARLCGGPARRGVVHFEGSFHGRTLGALAATDNPDYQSPFTPLPAGFRKLAWDQEAALAAIDESTAAVLVEPIQGESGVRVASADWLRALRRRCDETGALLVFDEVQCGLGRTGTLWAHEACGVTPDIMTLAKPLAGGLPMGAVLVTEAVAAAVRPGHHATTFGGGPLLARVALRVLARVSDPLFLAEVRRKGERLQAGLAALDSPLIREARGRGLLTGVQLTVAPRQACAAALDEGLLLVPAGDGVVRFLPPLNVSDDEIDEATERFARALASLTGARERGAVG